MKRIGRYLYTMLCTSAMLAAFASAVVQPAAYAADEPVYQALIAMQSKYPEGKTFNNNNYYNWSIARFNAYGCAAFAAELSDAAFGSLPVKRYYSYNNIRVGDVLRMNNDSHSVIVLTVSADQITVAEGNYGGKVHWNRAIRLSEVRNGTTTYGITRYPDRGDVNGTGGVSVEDAQLALAAYTKQVSGQNTGLYAGQLSAADADLNGALSVQDAQLILMYYTRAVVGRQNISWEQLMR